MDMALFRRYVCDPEMCFRLRLDHCIPLSIDWSVRAGCSLEWKQSESKQKARYYRITAKGKKAVGLGSGPMGGGLSKRLAR